VGLQWRFDTEGSVISSPAVLGDTVWVGSSDGWLYALDRVNGALHWKRDLQSPISASPTVASGRVIVQTMNGGIYALRSNSGDPIWHVETGSELAFHWRHEGRSRSPH
jgi:outer membrane protein assembly factor BamB